MKKRTVLLVIILLAIAFLASCTGAGDSRGGNADIDKTLESYGYTPASDEEMGEDEASFGFFSGFTGDEETKSEKKKIKKMQSLIVKQTMYTNEELDDKTGFVNLLFVVETKKEEDTKTLADYYDSQYRSMEGCKASEKAGIREYRNYEDVYYLKAVGYRLIKGQCNEKVIKDTEEMLEKL